MTSAGSPSTISVAPLAKRASSLLACSTTKAPSSPCGRPTRPTRTSSCSPSVGNLEDIALVRAGARGPHDAAERARHPPLAPDHLADVVLRHEEVEDDRVLPLLGLDAHRVRVVDEPAGDPLEELGH